MNLFYGRPVNEQFLVAKFDHISRNTDYPFDKILAGIFGEFKHNDIFPLWVVDGNYGFL